MLPSHFFNLVGLTFYVFFLLIVIVGVTLPRKIIMVPFGLRVSSRLRFHLFFFFAREQ